MQHRHPLHCLIAAILALACISWTPWGAIYESARDERSVGDQAIDKQVSLSIKADLAKRDAKKALKVHVYCFLKHVYLIGAVDDTAFRTFAVKTAQKTENVKKVTRYFVKESDTTVDDVKIEAKVRAALIGEKALSSTQIESEVLGREVILLGMVRNKADARMAIRIARGISGVTKVTSFLIPSK